MATCHGVAMAWPWQCHGIAMAMPWQCHGIAMAMRWHCHGNAMASPWQCHGIAKAVPWHCHGFAMAMPWVTGSGSVRFAGSVLCLVLSGSVRRFGSVQLSDSVLSGSVRRFSAAPREFGEHGAHNPSSPASRTAPQVLNHTPQPEQYCDLRELVLTHDILATVRGEGRL